MRPNRLFLLAWLIALASCDHADVPTAVPPVTVKPTPVGPTTPTPGPLATLTVSAASSGPGFAGMPRTYYIRGVDANNRVVSTSAARVTVSDARVAVIEKDQVVTSTFGGLPTENHSVVLRLVDEGTAVLLVELEGKSETVTVSVNAFPPPTTALAVESFLIVEYRPECAWDCPYVAYAPLLRLRETTGTTHIDVVMVQYDFGALTTGFCRDNSIHFGPGAVGYVNGIDPYLWNNDLLFVTLTGVPLPDGAVRARAIVRNSVTGDYGYLETTGSIQRLATNAHPALPPPTTPYSWTC